MFTKLGDGTAEAQNSFPRILRPIQNYPKMSCKGVEICPKMISQHTELTLLLCSVEEVKVVVVYLYVNV